MNYFFIISSLLLLCVQLTKTSCEVRPCKQLISHFYFSNTTPDGKSTYFTPISIIDSNYASSYINQLTLAMQKQAARILNQKGFIDSIKDRFSSDARKSERLDNALITFNNTYLVINELFSPALFSPSTIEDEKKITIMQEQLAIIKKTFQDTNNTKIITTRLSEEINILLDQRIKAAERWFSDFNSENVFFGFSLTKTIKAPLSLRTKNFLGDYIPWVAKTIPQNRLCYMTSIFKTIFKKINTLIYWHYILRKINNTGIEIQTFNTIKSKLSLLYKNLNDYCERINNKIIGNKKKDGNIQLEATIEIQVVNEIKAFIYKNSITIDELFPKLPTQKDKQQEPEKIVCQCPYLQTDINFNLKIKNDDFGLIKNNTYQKNVSATLYVLIDEINRIKFDKKPLPRDLITQFSQLAVLYYQIWPQESEKNRSTIEATFKEQIQHAFEFIKKKKLEEFINKCTSVSQNINQHWIHQLAEKEFKGNIVTRGTKWTAASISNLWKKVRYFFGFSLLTSSKKNLDFNRYTYMIRQLEDIFEMVNVLLPWYTTKSTIALICKEKNCNPIEHLIDPLKELITNFSQYQKHFFFGKEKIIGSYEQDKENTYNIVAKLADTEESQALQVGIEYAIVDRIIAWIQENISIIDNIQKKPVITPVKKGENKGESKSSSSSNDSEEYSFLDEQDFNDNKSLLEENLQPT